MMNKIRLRLRFMPLHHSEHFLMDKIEVIAIACEQAIKARFDRLAEKPKERPYLAVSKQG